MSGEAQSVDPIASADSDSGADRVLGMECRDPETGQPIFCPERGLVPGATGQLREETRGLLRSRLLAVSAFFLAAALLFVVRGLLLPEQFFWTELVVLVGFLAACVALLASRRPLRLRSLRGIEVLLFGTIVVFLVAVNWQATMQWGTDGRADLLGTVPYRTALAFMALIVAYGMFVPNDWQRATVGVSVMTAIPVGLVVYYRTGASVADAFVAASGDLENATYPLAYLLIGSILSVFGAHTMHRIRKGALEAQEMGMYRLVERIGAGGMGEVWRAEHRMLARPAAIKMIRREALEERHSKGESEGAETAVRRFLREARATASLRSPHTVELYDFGVTGDGVFYYVMEYLEGIDLEKLVERFGPLPPERVVAILRQAADSLAEAHRKGLIHRDIKPSNLHIGSMGTVRDFVKVLDFGLVLPRREQGTDVSRLTQEGTTTGTPAYMSPEMALGNKPLDHRADVYSLGCVAYWLLTGRLVFESDSPMEIVVNHVKTAPEPPSRKTEMPIPESLDEIVLDCLAKDAEERPDSMETLVARLRTCEIEESWTQDRAEAWWKLHLPEVDGVPTAAAS